MIFIDIPGVVSSNVGTPIGTCNNIFVSPVIKTEQTDPEVTSSWPVYLKSRANWRGIKSYLPCLNKPKFYIQNDGINPYRPAPHETVDLQFVSGVRRHWMKS